MMKYAVFGGTFDPPHTGHLAIAKAALEALDIDELIWIPAAKNPIKRWSNTSPQSRLAMVLSMVESEPRMSVSDIEITRGGDSFAIDTIKELRKVRPGKYWFVLGSDALSTMTSWKQPEKLLEICRLLVVARVGTELGNVLDQLPNYVQSSIDVVDERIKDISSTMIRDAIPDGSDFDHLVTKEVAKYIEEQQLYRE